MSTGHQSPQSSLPPLSLKTVNTTTWGSGGNTCTITDAYIHPNSVILVQVNGAIPPADFWAIGTPTQGSVVITSGSAESSTLALSYIIL